MALEVNEKTLELNITKEILALADSFLQPWPDSLRPYFLPYNETSTYALGLTLQAEGKNECGGYDVEIQSPGLSEYPDRALFIQFKAGYHKNYSSNMELFQKKNGEPKHVLFYFNSYKSQGTRQHQQLKNLKSELQGKKSENEKEVVYAFPTIANQNQLVNNLNHLCQHTCFLSLEEMDRLSEQTNGYPINCDHEHEFRCSYLDHNKRGIYSKPLNIGGLYYDKTAEVMGEVIVQRILKNLGSKKLKTADLSENYSSFFDSLIRYFQINNEEFTEYLAELPGIRNNLPRSFSIYYGQGKSSVPTEKRIFLIKSIIKKMEPLLNNDLNSIEWNYLVKIPQKEGLKLSLDYDPSTINYQIF